MNVSQRLLAALATSSCVAAIALNACSDSPAATPATDASVSETGTPDAPAPPVDAGSCPPVAPRACTAKACTTQLGGPATCVNDVCVKIKSEECPLIIGPYDDDNALFIGAVHDLFGPQKGPGVAGMNSIELAVSEINGRGGLRDTDRCKPARPIVVVGCNDSNVNPDGTPYVAPAGDGGTALTRQQRMVDHVAGDLNIPVFVGGTTSGTTLAINNYMQPKYKRLYLTSRSTSPLFERPTTFDASPDGVRLFWRTTANAKGQTAALRIILGQSADAVKLANSISSVKVAVLTKNDAFGLGTTDAFEQGLLVNGAPAGGAAVNASYLRLNYRERPGVGTADQVEQSDALAALKAFAPDIIVTVGTDELVSGTSGINDPRNTGLIKPYEAYLDGLPTARKPQYVHSHAAISVAFSAFHDNLGNFGGSAANRTAYLKRVRGTNISSPTALSAAFFNRYTAQFNAPTSLVYGMGEAYDSAYVAAYLYAATVSKGVPDAKTLAQAFPALVEGATSVDVGPTTFTTAVQTLSTGGKLNYNGASGPLDWDYSIGEAPFDVNVWCVQVNAATSSTFYQQSAGQVWRYATGRLEGAYSCPQD